MPLNTYISDLSSLIKRKRSVETEVSFDIPYQYRISAFDAFNYAKRIGCELNTLIEFEFQKDLSNSDNDIARVRKASQYIRVCVRNCGVTPYQIYTRHSNTEGTIEKVGIVTNVPDGNFDNVKSIVENWTFENFDVTDVGSQTKSFVNSEADVISYLFRAIDTHTRVRHPDALSELSGKIVGPRTFVALKLRNYNRES